MEKDVGKRIAKLRKEKGFSQAQLAEMLNISDKAISKWENGGMPSVDIFPKLSKIFNVSIDYLMIGNDLNEEDDCYDEYIENDEISTEEPDFETSIASYTIEDIKIILKDQRDLFTVDEIKILEERYEYLINNNVEPEEETEEEEYISEEEKINMAISQLPKNYVCPKCDGINENPSRHCNFCGHDFWEDLDKVRKKSELGCLAYIIAFFFPLIGIIVGLVKGNKNIIIFSLVIFILSIIISVMLTTLGVLGAMLP